ncbi:hypothetical protein CI610_02688 [invertebrate metagenome]|uniref:DUF4892 domain-containing protein n=1 Tax=invertebrate metagenome TaxID=1711999 RepID=A0A2H9T589_9ZZZZ
MRHCLLLVLTLINFHAFAASAMPLKNIIQPYPNATIEKQQKERKINYRLVSSSLKKVNNVIKADTESWENGLLLRTLYRLPEGHSSFSAFDFFIQQLNARKVKPVFQCVRFSCGESSYWANEVFNESQLFGLNKEQNYYIGESDENGQTIYYIVYTIKRGNHRVYALIDQFYVDKAEILASAKISHPEIQDHAFDTLTELYRIVKDKWDKAEHQQLIIYLGSKPLDSFSEYDRMTETLNEYKKALDASLSSDYINERFYRIYVIQDVQQPSFAVKNYFVRITVL